MIYISIYWGIETILPLISGIIFIIAFVVCYKQYKSKKHPFALYMMIGILLGLIWTSCRAIFYLFYRTIYLKIFWDISSFALIGLCFALILVLDSISRDSLDINKMVLFTALSSISITFYYIISISDGELKVNLNTLHNIYSMIHTFLAAFIWFLYSLKIYLKTPRQFRKYSLLNLFGGILVGIITPLVVSLGLNVGFAMNMILISIGLLLSIIAFTKEPKLAGILPFKVINLTVIDTESGLSIFSFDWNTKEHIINDDLFSNLLQGISAILNEAVNRGNAREIRLDEAIIILDRSEKYPVACVLTCTKSSKSLRYALNLFTEKFCDKYSDGFADMYNVGQFKRADQLISDCFPFVPRV